MSILYILVPVAVLLALSGILAFRWAVSSGQFDDVQTPAIRILLDDEMNLSNPTELQVPMDKRPANEIENTGADPNKWK